MKKIKKLRKIFNKVRIDGYIVPKNDEYFGEYVSEYNDRLNYISNFTGSYGFSLILKNNNYLFIDGRYTLQAMKQSGNFFKISTFPRHLPKDVLKNKKTKIGFDPKLFTKKILNIFFRTKNCEFIPLENNLIDEIWKRKRRSNNNNFYVLPKHSVGYNYKYKINKVVSFMKKKGADYQFISASENNAWLLNIRGRDSNYTPLPNSYILLNKNKKIKFFCDLKKITPSLKKKFRDVEFIKIDHVKKILSQISKKKILTDEKTCSIYFEKIISKKNSLLNFQDPIYYFKAIKSKKEIKNIKIAHIQDGVALTKYLLWLKKNFDKKKTTEISASKKLFEFRKRNKNFKFLSFPTISGSGPNGAIIHYKASKRSNRVLKKGDIYLVDSGGQY